MSGIFCPVHRFVAVRINCSTHRILCRCPKEILRRTGNDLSKSRQITNWLLEFFRKEDQVRVATFLTVIGDEALDVYNAFTWDSEDDKIKIDKVLEQFDNFCEPQKNTIYERYLFFSRGQPREVLPKFRNEIPENFCSIRSPTRNLRNFWSNGKRPLFTLI